PPAAMTPPPTSNVVTGAADGARALLNPSAAPTAAPAQSLLRKAGTTSDELIRSRSLSEISEPVGVHNANSRSSVATASSAVSGPKLLACAVACAQLS